MNTRAVIVAFALAFSSQSVLAASPIGSDDFDDNVRSPVNWGEDFKTGAAALTETNGRLEYTAGPNPTFQDAARWDWAQYAPGPDFDWTYQIDISMPVLAITEGAEVRYGLRALSPLSSFFAHARQFRTGGILNRELNLVTSGGVFTQPLTSDLISLRFRFENGTLFADFDADGPVGDPAWTQLGFVPGLAPDVVSVVAQSTLAAVTSLDNVYGDNVVAIPEPDVYAMLLAGLLLVGWSVNRRRAAS